MADRSREELAEAYETQIADALDAFVALNGGEAKTIADLTDSAREALLKIARLSDAQRRSLGVLLSLEKDHRELLSKLQKEGWFGEPPSSDSRSGS